METDLCDCQVQSASRKAKHCSTSFLVSFCDSFWGFGFAFAGWAALPLKTLLSWDKHTLSLLSCFTHSYLCSGLPPTHHASSVTCSQSMTISKQRKENLNKKNHFPHTYRLHHPTQLCQQQCSRWEQAAGAAIRAKPVVPLMVPAQHILVSPP